MTVITTTPDSTIGLESTPQATPNVSAVATPSPAQVYLSYRAQGYDPSAATAASGYNPNQDSYGGMAASDGRRDRDSYGSGTGSAALDTSDGRQDRDSYGTSSATPTLSQSSVTSAMSAVAGSASNGVGSNVTASTSAAEPADFRIRVSPVNAAAFYGSSGILQPLKGTNGVLFPYAPTISFEQTVDYSTLSMVHVNTDYLAYQKTPSVTLTIQGKFTVQTQEEGIYALAAIHFFRTASKMYFGEKAGDKAGLPPPVLRLNGYGKYMFNNLNCYLKQHSFSYADGIDTVLVSASGGSVRLPAMFDLSCTLTVQQTPQKMRAEFDLDAFRTGQLMLKGGWI